MREDGDSSGLVGGAINDDSHALLSLLDELAEHSTARCIHTASLIAQQLTCAINLADRVFNTAKTMLH